MKASSELVDSLWESLEPGSALLQALQGLSPQSQRAIYLRFWENSTIEEISDELRLTWDEADFLIEESIFNLREHLSLVLDLLEISHAG